MAQNKFELNHEGANELRGFAEKMEACLTDIEDATKKYVANLEENIDGTGVLKDKYEEVEETLNSAVRILRNAIAPLPEAMKRKAQAIDEYVDRNRNFF